MVVLSVCLKEEKKGIDREIQLGVWEREKVDRTTLRHCAHTVSTRFSLLRTARGIEPFINLADDEWISDEWPVSE